ncbi:hypothetical protein BDV06DRAFT_43347 [Aspergillus oleicola]
MSSMRVTIAAPRASCGGIKRLVFDRCSFLLVKGGFLQKVAFCVSSILFDSSSSWGRLKSRPLAYCFMLSFVCLCLWRCDHVCANFLCCNS